MMLGQEDVEHGQVGKGFAFPDGLHPGERSGTQGINRTIIWSWADSTAPPWGNTTITLGGACGPPSDPQPPRWVSTDSFRPYGGKSQKLNQRSQGIIIGYWKPCGGSSTRESPRAGTLHNTKPYYDVLAVRSTRAWNQTGGGGRRIQEER